jgi:hypothetical protein
MPVSTTPAFVAHSNRNVGTKKKELALSICFFCLDVSLSLSISTCWGYHTHSRSGEDVYSLHARQLGAKPRSTVRIMETDASVQAARNDWETSACTSSHYPVSQACLCKSHPTEFQLEHFCLTCFKSQQRLTMRQSEEARDNEDKLFGHIFSILSLTNPMERKVLAVPTRRLDTAVIALCGIFANMVDFVDSRSIVTQKIRSFLSSAPHQRDLIKAFEGAFALLSVNQFCFILCYVVTQHEPCDGFVFKWHDLIITRAFFKVFRDSIDNDPKFLGNTRLLLNLFLMRWFQWDPSYVQGTHEKYVNWLLSPEHARIEHGTVMRTLFACVMDETNDTKIGANLWTLTQIRDLFNAEVDLHKYARAEALKEPHKSAFVILVQMAAERRTNFLYKCVGIPWLRILVTCCTPTANEEALVVHGSMAWDALESLTELTLSGHPWRARLHLLAFLLWTCTTDEQAHRSETAFAVVLRRAPPAFTQAGLEFAKAVEYADWPDLTSSARCKRMPIQILWCPGFQKAVKQIKDLE